MTNTAVHKALVETARELGPLIRENSDRGERDRHLPPATAEALAEAGLFRLCRPHQLGGLETDPLTVIDVVEEIGRHDGSAAWCALNCGIAGVLQAFTSHEGAAEIGAGVVNGIIAPSGRAVEVDGGYRVTGRWAFVSNCHYCDWLVPTNFVFTGDAMKEGEKGPEMVMTWIERSDVEIVDTWDTSGMRATGSHDIEVSDVFVPTYRAIALPEGEAEYAGALFRFPIVGLFSVGMAAAALGIAHAAIDELFRLAATKTPFGMASTLATRSTTQLAVCEATATADAARALLVTESARVWELAQAGTPVLPHHVAPLRVAATHAVTASAGVVDRMYTAAGGTAVFAASPLQRCLRDVHTITQHHFVAPTTYEMLGQILLDLEPDGFML